MLQQRSTSARVDPPPSDLFPVTSLALSWLKRRVIATLAMFDLVSGSSRD